MSIENVWNEYKKQRDGEFFTENVSVAFVPTAAGARGIEETKKFLSAAYDTRLLGVKENVLYQTVGQNSIVEESETTIKFVSGEGAWIVPGVDERYTIDKHVVFPTVTVATFEDDKISSIRVYWDQATVLKQLQLIGERNTWPVLGERQIDTVKDISNALLNPFGRIESTAARMNPNQITTGRRNVHTSSRVNQPGGTGGKSSIFNSDPDDHVTNRRFNSNKNQSQFSIGDDQAQPSHDPIQHSQKKLNPQGKNVSQVVIGDGGEVEGIRMSRATAAARNNFKPSSREV